METQVIEQADLNLWVAAIAGAAAVLGGLVAALAQWVTTGMTLRHQRKESRRREKIEKYLKVFKRYAEWRRAPEVSAKSTAWHRFQQAMLAATLVAHRRHFRAFHEFDHAALSFHQLQLEEDPGEDEMKMAQDRLIAAYIPARNAMRRDLGHRHWWPGEVWSKLSGRRETESVAEDGEHGDG